MLWVAKDASRKLIIEWRSKRLVDAEALVQDWHECSVSLPCWKFAISFLWLPGRSDLQIPATRLNVKNWWEMPCFRKVMGSRHLGTNVKVGGARHQVKWYYLILTLLLQTVLELVPFAVCFPRGYDPPFLLGSFLYCFLCQILFQLQHWSLCEVFCSSMAVSVKRVSIPRWFGTLLLDGQAISSHWLLHSLPWSLEPQIKKYWLADVDSSP